MANKLSKRTEYQPEFPLRLFVQTLLTPEVMGNKDKAAAITGVSKGKYYWALNHKSEFRAWYSDQCQRFLDEQEHFAAFCLIRNIKNGSDAALKLYYQMKGKLKSDIDQSSVHIGDKRETHITQIHDCRQVILNVQEKLPEEKRKKLSAILRRSAQEAGLIPKQKTVKDGEKTDGEQDADRTAIANN